MGKKLLKRSAAFVMMLLVLSTGLVVNAEGTYTVEKGDYLKKIAQSVYGDPDRWEDIYEANKASVKNPNILYKGQVLILPDIDPVPTENPGETVTVDFAMTLEQWTMSEECKEVEQTVNEMMEGTGMTIALKADGNILSYQFAFSPEVWGSFTAEEMKDAFVDADFEEFMESQLDVSDGLDQEFDEAYGIKLEGIRFVYIAPDGVPFYSVESRYI